MNQIGLPNTLLKRSDAVCLNPNSLQVKQKRAIIHMHRKNLDQWIGGILSRLVSTYTRLIDMQYKNFERLQ